MRVTVDTNLFVYMLDGRDPAKQAAAIELVDSLQRGRGCAVALQACGELYAVLTRRFKRATWEAAQAARNLMTSFDTYGTSRTAVERALAEASAGRFGYWDALLLSSAHEEGCEVCFSEDMTDGARLGNVEVIAPFGPTGALSDRARVIIAKITSSG